MSNPSLLKRYMRAFLSYSTKDFVLSEKLYQQLNALLSSIWIDRLEMRAGDNLSDKIKEGISTSDVLLVLVTKHSIKSAWVREEIKIAMELGTAGKGPKIVPLVLFPCNVPATLRGKLYVKISRQDLKINEILRAIYRDDFVLTLKLTNEFQLDRASLAASLGQYLGGLPKKIRVNVDNRNFNDRVTKVLQHTMKHKQIFIDNVDRLRQLDEELPVSLPAFWSSLAAISEQLISDLFDKGGQDLGTVREITDAIESIFEYSLHSLAFYLSPVIFPDEAKSLKELGLATFLIHNYCTDPRELTFKRIGVSQSRDFHVIDLVGKDGYIVTRVWAPISQNDHYDLQGGMRADVSPVAPHWYREYMPQIVGREILHNSLHSGLPIEKWNQRLGLHLDDYEEAGLG